MNDLVHDPKNATPFDLLVSEIDDLYAEAANWADGKPIASQEQHDEVERLFNSLRDLGNKAEEMRKEEVKPFDEGKAAVQARFHPLIGDTKAGKGKVVLGKAALNSLLAAWRDKERRRKEAEARKAQEEAAEEARKAQEAMRESSGDLAAREKAEEQARQAEIASEDAKRMSKAATTGNKLRVYYHPEIEDASAAISHYWKARQQRFLNLVLELAREDFRGGNHNIPGIKAVEDRRAV